MWSIEKFTLFTSAMNRLSEIPFKNFIDDSGELRYKNFVGMLTCLLISTACFNCFKQSGVAFLKKLSRKGVISGATHNDTFIKKSWGYQIPIQNLTILNQSQNHENFEHFSVFMWKICGVEWLGVY